MNPDLYLVRVGLALAELEIAMAQAQSLLPPEIMSHQWAGSSRHSPALWAAAEMWYGTQPNCDQQVWDTLTDLKLLAEAAACLITVVKSREREGVTPDLGLAKVRWT